jgi:hypothetical protein
MEPIDQFQVGFVALPCLLFLIYGAWLCITEVLSWWRGSACRRRSQAAGDKIATAEQPPS